MTVKVPTPSASQKANRHIEKFRLWSAQEREESMLQTLEQRDSLDDIWIFAYGSLIWRTEFEFKEDRIAKLAGFHRSLCLWSSVNRGTPECPGLVFGLDAGGTCEGKAYNLNSANIHEQFRTLWKREMPSGAYIPKWVTCATSKGNITALTFVMNRHSYAYADGLTEEEKIHIILQAHGNCGSCPEYVIETAKALKQASIHDEKLFNLVHLIQQQL